MANAFKPIKCGELVRTNPYNVYKSWVITDSNYRDDYYSISILKAISPLFNQKINVSESISGVIAREADELDNSQSNNTSLLSNMFQKNVWSSLNQTFYKHRAGIEPLLYNSASILSIPVRRMGDGIRPGSITIDDMSVTSSIVPSISLKDVKVNEYHGYIVDNAIQTSSFASSENLIAYWSFDNNVVNKTIGTDNDIKDFSGYGNTAIGKSLKYSGGVTTSGSVQSKSGTKVTFNGTDSYIVADHNRKFSFFKDTDYSLSLWVELPTSQSDTSDNFNWIINKNSSYRDYGVDTTITPTFTRRNVETSIYPFEVKVYNQNTSDNGKISISLSDGINSTSVTSSTFLNDNQSHHITFNKSGSSLELWIDGVRESSSSINLNDQVYNEYDIVIGSKFLSNSVDVSTDFKTLSGSVDEVRVYNTKLSESEILSLSDNNYISGSLYQTNVVGEVFYKHGVVVISSAMPIYNNVLLGSTGDWDYGSDDGFTAKFKSTKQLHEVSLICEIGANEFNVSQNPSLRVNNDINNEFLKGFVTGSDFRPYITSIGLYNDYGELLAIAKLGSALKKRYDVDVNVNVRFDLDGVFGTPNIGVLPDDFNPTIVESDSGNFIWNRNDINI